MNAEILAELQVAAAETEMTRGGELFQGVDGNSYIGTFAAPDSFAEETEGFSMTSAGYADRETITLTCSRVQFGVIPVLTWRRGTLKRTGVTPNQTLVINRVSTGDPLFYGFVCTHHQALQPG